jgi:hypothetical protein
MSRPFKYSKSKECVWKYLPAVILLLLMGVWCNIQEDKLTEGECESVSSCLLLLRNILHIPESHVIPIGSGRCSKQNQILWNLFTQSVDKILIQLMTCPQKVRCTSNILRTIYLLFV